MTEEEVTELKYARAKIIARVREEASSIAAIKALEKKLEQNSVLDKIRVEIEVLNPVDYGSISSYESHNAARYMKDDILDIIDKYSEEMR